MRLFTIDGWEYNPQKEQESNTYITIDNESTIFKCENFIATKNVVKGNIWNLSSPYKIYLVMGY